MKDVGDAVLNLVNDTIFANPTGGLVTVFTFLTSEDGSFTLVDDSSPTTSLISDETTVAGGDPAQFFDFDLYTVTLASGAVLRFTSADFDIADGLGHTWSSKGLRVDEANSKVTAHWKVGLDKDTWVLVLMPRAIEPLTGQPFPDAVNGVPFLQACQGGALDSADWQVDRAIFASMPTWPIAAGGAVPAGIVSGIFAGVTAQVDTSSTLAAITIDDYRSLLSISMPYHLYSGQCRHTLFDIGCTANDTTLPASSFATNGSAVGGSTQASIANTLPVPAGSGTYVQGRIVMTSGRNAGFQRTISGWNGTHQPFALLIPLPFPIVSGDTFTAYPGCAKNQAACNAFGNILNFGGQTWVPVPETAA